MDQNNIAFKEWASIVNALATGKQILILRKGGIREETGEFKVEHNDFFLFPTFEHQKKEDLKPEAHLFLDEALKTRVNPSQIPIQYYAKTHGVYHIDQEKDLSLIDSFHVWSETSIKQRFHFGTNKGLYVLAVKVFKLSKPCMIPNKAEYGGCKSWVEFDSAIPLVGLMPVLPEPAFSHSLKAIELKLSSSKTP